MVDFTPQTVSISNSILIDVQGNQYNYTHSSIGECGTQKLFKASCPAALHSSHERYPPSRCLEGTRTTILNEIYSWIYSEHEPILWLSGPAGSGKSAIAQTVAEQCEEHGILASTFFFSRGAEGRDEAKRLVATISSQLVLKFPEKRAQLGKFIESNPFILHKPIDAQFQNLVLPLFVASPNSTDTTPHSRIPSIIIIDGLDECGSKNDQREIVRCISQLMSACTIPVRVIIISRPEPHIMESFDCCHSRACHKPLHRPGDQVYIKETEQDIYTYLRHEFNRIYQEHKLSKKYWPGDDRLRRLAGGSYTGIFVYASTVIKYVDDHDFYPVERLDEVFNQEISSGSSPLSALDALYTHILKGHKDRDLLLRVLIAVCCSRWWVQDYFEDGGLAQFLQIEEGKVSAALRHTHSILNPKTMKFYHTSFRNFIFSRERAGQYYIDEHEGHISMARLTLDHISRGDTGSKPYRYSIDGLQYHLAESGPWDRHPDLLEAMATMLNSKGAKDVKFHHFASQAYFWPWFEIDEASPTNFQRDLIYLGDRFFKLWWRHKICFIFLLYEHCSLQDLLEFDLNGVNMPLNCVHHIGFCTHIGPEPEHDKRMLIVDNMEGIADPGPTLIDLIVKHIHQNHRSDARRIGRGHAYIIAYWLHILSKPQWLCTPRSRAHSYRKKYWSAHLSQVPLGNKMLLNSLKNHMPSDFIGRLTTEELQSLLEWLKASQLKIQEFPLLGRDGWFEIMDEIDDDDDDVIDWVKEGDYWEWWWKI